MPEAKDVVSILEACAKARVLSLQYGALSATFSPEGYIPSSPTGWPTSVISQEDQKRIMAEHESRLKQDELENLRLSDPELYEEMVLQDQLSAPAPHTVDEEPSKGIT